MRAFRISILAILFSACSSEHGGVEIGDGKIRVHGGKSQESTPSSTAGDTIHISDESIGVAGGNTAGENIAVNAPQATPDQVNFYNAEYQKAASEREDLVDQADDDQFFGRTDSLRAALDNLRNLKKRSETLKAELAKFDPNDPNASDLAARFEALARQIDQDLSSFS